jgi:hypothetical protein
MTRPLLLLALCGPLLAAPAAAQSMPPPPSMNDPGSAEPKKKVAPKPRPANPAPSQEAGKPPAAKPTAKASAKTAAPQGGYRETLPLPRKIDPRDIDDPYGGVGSGGSRVSPMMTPSGRPGVGGRF